MRPYTVITLATFFACLMAKGEDVSFLGTYKMTDSVFFDEYMESVGVGWWLRLLASTAKPTTQISKIGDDWTIKTWTTFTTTTINFKLGEEFDETTADGRHCQSTITLEGENKLKHIQKCANMITEIDRVFDGNTLTMKLPFPGTDNRICVRTYDKE